MKRVVSQHQQLSLKADRKEHTIMGWGTREAGGLLGHFIGRVKKSEWDTNARFKGDGKNTLLFWEVEVRDILQESFDKVPPEEITVGIGIGSGWNADVDGYTVEFQDDPTVEEFVNNSLYGKIVNLVAGETDTYPGANVMDGGPELEVAFGGVGEYMAQHGHDDPRDARIWEGMIFEFRGVGFKYRNQDEMRMKPVPARFIGVGEGDGLDSDGPSEPAEAVQEATRTDTTQAWVEAGASDDTAGTLAQLVRTSGSHSAFARNALVLDDVKSDDKLKAAVMDEANGPWSAR
jgi:hypothetical protein